MNAIRKFNKEKKQCTDPSQLEQIEQHLQEATLQNYGIQLPLDYRLMLGIAKVADASFPGQRGKWTILYQTHNKPSHLPPFWMIEKFFGRKEAADEIANQIELIYDLAVTDEIERAKRLALTLSKQAKQHQQEINTNPNASENDKKMSNQNYEAIKQLKVYLDHLLKTVNEENYSLKAEL